MLRNPTSQEVMPVVDIQTPTFSVDTIVTITKDGRPLSRFGDDTWDYSATSSNTKTLNFQTKLWKIIPNRESGDDYFTIRRDAIYFLKLLTLHWVNILGGCSTSKLFGDVTAIAYLVRYCFDKNISMNEIFSTPEAINYLIENGTTDKQIGLALGKIQRFVDTANSLSNDVFWRTLAPSIEFRLRLRRARKKFPETTDSVQTMVIPSRIYQGLLKKTIEDLESFLSYEKDVKYIFEMRTVARDEGVSLDRNTEPSQLTKTQMTRVSARWKKMIRDNKALRLSLKAVYGAKIAKSESWVGLVDNLSRWQLRCAILISAFTGMRKGELLAIPLDGLRYLTTDHGDIPVVWSTTTKLESNGSPRFTRWVTSSAVKLAFQVARIIAEGALSWSDDRSSIVENLNDVPLFLSVEYGKKSAPHPCFEFTTTSFNGGSFSAEIYEGEIKVSEQDVSELSWFLYGENIPENIRVGQLWPLTFHQFRRSMAVYAAASGLVSYPVLKAQLKHISMVMTVYYSDSNSRAVNILGDEKEVKALRSEWVEAKAKAESDELYRLIQNKQPLAGCAGKQLRTQQMSGELPHYLENRKATKQAVKNGKIRYRSTLVGGCMSIKPCNKGAGVLASACISCENAVFLPGSRAALEQTRMFYESELDHTIPKRAREEYEKNIRQIDIFLNNLIEATEVSGNEK